MTADEDKGIAAARLDSWAVDTVIRISLLALLAYWCLTVIGPFLTVALWSAILTVALYPLFSWMARILGSRQLAAAVMTLLSLMIVIGPVTWLGFGLIGGVEVAVKGFDSDILTVPLPPESVKGWPLIGERVFEAWSRAATDTRAILFEIVPKLRPLGGKLLEIAGSVVFGLLEFVASIIIAGFLYAPGPRLARSLETFLRRIFGGRSEEMLKLAGSTIRNVSRGVVGVALVQSFLAGAGFLVAGVPAAGFLTLVALVLGIIQIGPSILLLPIVIWSWTAMDPTKAAIFTLYMIPVGLVDNVLRPIVMARGLATPMPVILVGVVGGTIAFGISGLFLGPIVLSVAWALAAAWVETPDTDASASAPAEAG
jgi:predicted PurR-regulated permease PerM